MSEKSLFGCSGASAHQNSADFWAPSGVFSASSSYFSTDVVGRIRSFFSSANEGRKGRAGTEGRGSAVFNASSSYPSGTRLNSRRGCILRATGG